MYQAFVPEAHAINGGDDNGSRKKPRQNRAARGDDSTDDEQDRDLREDGRTVSRIYDEIIRGRGLGKNDPAAGNVNDTETEAEVEFGPAPNPHATPKGFFCPVCQEHVTSVSEDKHNTSILHIFNQQHRPQSRKVQIDENNRGFQLLEGMGWKLDEGLGARKQGRVNPLQTTFKTDTSGLGAGRKLKPRVTHFPSHVPSQARNSSDGKSDAVRAHERLSAGNGGGHCGRCVSDRRENNDQRHKRRRRGRGVGRSYPDGDGHDMVLGEGQGNRRGRCQAFPQVGENGCCHRNDCRVVDDGGESGKARSGGSTDGGAGGARGLGAGAVSNNDGRVSCRGTGADADGRYSHAAHCAYRKRGVGGACVGKRTGRGVFLTRIEREAEGERERRKDRRRRFELFSDIPEEYAALL